VKKNSRVPRDPGTAGDDTSSPEGEEEEEEEEVEEEEEEEVGEDGGLNERSPSEGGEKPLEDDEEYLKSRRTAQ